LECICSAVDLVARNVAFCEQRRRCECVDRGMIWAEIWPTCRPLMCAFRSARDIIRGRFEKAQRDVLRSGQPILGLLPKVLLQVALPMPHTASIVEPTSPQSRDV